VKTKQAIITGFALLGALIIYTLALYNRLPEMLPIHWNIRGEVDGWAAKQTAVLIMPGMVIVLIGMMVGLPAISPKQFTIASFRNTFNYIMLVVSALMAYIHILMLQTGLHPELNMNRSLLSGMFLFVFLMGNMMGKVRRNFWMGVKTPWTLASDRVWDATHRLAGRLMVGAGVLGCLLATAGVTPGPCIVLLIAAALYPAVYSYFLYKQLEGSDKL
jgi:uncharacterized membrane protein